MSRLRVLQVTHDLHPGGLPRVVDTLVRTLDRTRFEVSVLCLRRRGALADALERDLGTRVYSLDRGDEADYLGFLKVRRHLLEHPADVVHTHNTECFFDGGLGARIAGVRTLVHTDHSRQWPDRLRWRVIEHCLSHLAYRVVGCADSVTADLRRYEKIPRRKLVTIPNGIDGSLYGAAIDTDAKRRELGLEPDAFVVGYASRLEPEKNCELLIRAFAALLDRLPDSARSTLVIAGYGSERARLEALCEELGIAPHVLFLGVRSDVHELLQVFDVHVLASNREGLPMILLEAMAAGCPTVSTAVGGIPNALESGTHGLLVPAGDIDAMAGALVRMATDPALRRACGQAAHQRFSEHYDASAMTARYELLYERRAGELADAPPR